MEDRTAKAINDFFIILTIWMVEQALQQVVRCDYCNKEPATSLRVEQATGKDKLVCDNVECIAQTKVLVRA